MAAFAQAHDMSLLPYGVVAGGFLSSKYLGLSARDVDVNTYSKGKYASVLGQTGGWAWLQRLLKVRVWGAAALCLLGGPGAVLPLGTACCSVQGMRVLSTTDAAGGCQAWLLIVCHAEASEL
jgi:hypothetical protein